MKNIVVASENPVKIEAVRSGFDKLFLDRPFEVQSIDVPSDVNIQPSTDEETLQGAINRSKNAAREIPGADFWVGIEGGIETHSTGMAAFAWVFVLSEHLTGRGRTGTFYLPPLIARLIREGKELGDADDIVFNTTNSKRENGAIGLLTGDVISRAQLYEQAVILALVPFKNEHLYLDGDI